MFKSWNLVEVPLPRLFNGSGYGLTKRSEASQSRNRARSRFPHGLVGRRSGGPGGISMKHLLSLGVVLLTPLAFIACDSSVAPESVMAVGSDAAPASIMANRGSWNGWHLHDLPYGSPQYTDETGLRHEDYNIWPVIWPDYPSEASPVVYCTDGAEKLLVGGDGGSKVAAGTCRNDLYIIQIQVNASDAPAPAGWTALPLGNGFTLNYRLTPR